MINIAIPDEAYALFCRWDYNYGRAQDARVSGGGNLDIADHRDLPQTSGEHREIRGRPA